MSLTLDQLKDAASDLPASQRAELGHFLLHSVDTQEEDAAHAEWLAVAERRMADVKAGNVVGIPAEEVLRTLLEPRP